MYFTDSHEWIEVKGDVGTVGITAYAQQELGDVVYLELPSIGEVVKAGEEAVILESTKAAADIYAPVSGEIIEVNEKLTRSPESVNQSPEKEGWLFKIRLNNRSELDKLLDRKAYKQLVDTSSDE